MTLLYTLFMPISLPCRRCRAEPPAFLLPPFCPPTAAHLLFGAGPKAGQMQAAEELGGKGLNSPSKAGAVDTIHVCCQPTPQCPH